MQLRTLTEKKRQRVKSHRKFRERRRVLRWKSECRRVGMPWRGRYRRVLRKHALLMRSAAAHCVRAQSRAQPSTCKISIQRGLSMAICVGRVNWKLWSASKKTHVAWVWRVMLRLTQLTVIKLSSRGRVSSLMAVESKGIKGAIRRPHQRLKSVISL